jgi:hypothetical protein
MKSKKHKEAFKKYQKLDAQILEEILDEHEG